MVIMRSERHKVLQICRAASIWGFLTLLLGHERSDRVLARRIKEGRSVLYIIAPLSHTISTSSPGLAQEGRAQCGQARGAGAGG